MLTGPVETLPKRGENIINIMLHLHTNSSSHTHTGEVALSLTTHTHAHMDKAYRNINIQLYTNMLQVYALSLSL